VTTVEWVETTAKTLEEAKDAALDQLGVAEDDAEFEVLAEPKQGLFGRTRGEARVRARIRPTQPRPKVERRDRRRRPPKGEGHTSTGDEQAPTTPEVAEAVSSGNESAAAAPAPAPSRGRGRRSTKVETTTEGAPMTETDHDVDFDAHIAIVESFVNGLVDAFGVEATLDTTKVDDENAEVRVEGADLGLLVGPKGATLAAVQELSRTVVHRQVPGTAEGRVRVDVAGYRQRRREALERFVQQVAEQVRTTGVQKALEPMTPPDRKVVHDTVNGIDGVGTLSEGEEPRRRVVIVPAGE
jgi:spoIIIJ-associated protein